MQFEIWTKSLADLPIDCIAVGVHDDGELAAEARALDLRGREKLARLLKRGDFTAKTGETWLIDSRNPRRTRIAGGLVRRRRVARRLAPRCSRPSAPRRTRIARPALALPRPRQILRRTPGAPWPSHRPHPVSRQRPESGKKPRAHVVARGRGALPVGAESERLPQGARSPGAALMLTCQSRQRLHAFLPRQDGAGPREDLQILAREGARPAGDQARKDGLLPRRHPGQRRAAALSRHRTPPPEGQERPRGAGRQRHHLRHRRHLAQRSAAHG